MWLAATPSDRLGSRASGVDVQVSGQPDTCESGGNFVYARDRRGSDHQRLDQFHSIAFHLIIDINVALCSGNALMPDQARQQSNADAFVGQCGDEGAPPAVTAAPIHPRPLVQVVKVLGHGVGAKALAWIGHRCEQCLRVRMPIAAGDVDS